MLWKLVTEFLSHDFGLGYNELDGESSYRNIRGDEYKNQPILRSPYRKVLTAAFLAVN
jgi:hypothetical protein